jgi:hypothetical protein
MPTQRATNVAAGFARRPAAVVGRFGILLKREKINKEEPRKGERK